MRIREMHWAAVDTYLKLVRLPFDAAIRMFPDGGTGVSRAAQAAVDGADTGIRAIVATVLGDPVSVDDASAHIRRGDRDERHDGRGHESHTSRARHSNGQQERGREQHGRMRPKAPTGGPQAAAARRSAAVAQSPPVPPEPGAGAGSRARAAAIAGTARRPARTAGNGSPSGARDVVTSEPQAPPASSDRVSSEPSHEEIAARAYELYQRGVPGDAESHWVAARRELTSPV